uniref:S-acyltransferase n=1 Tax=Gossypium raimondii TaxID=29730 RepID=A0A0D2TYS9_GOSRA|nr:hypothetical protein B456_009G328100 [Gossypium raimondii]
MLFVICGGVWAAFPIIFLVSYTSGIVHSVITTILALTTISTFGLSAFQCAGAPPMILWGSYTVVGKGELENYTFCHYCSKPKSPRAHHCRSCGMCILDMDHHCPFIGNCVGAANHRHFIAFLISAIFSTIYVTVMCAYTSFLIWPPLRYKPPEHSTIFSTGLMMLASREGFVALLSSAMELPQLCYIYEGRTYLSHLSSREGDHVKEKDCQNLLRFFGCRYSKLRFLPTLRNSRKRHKT